MMHAAAAFAVIGLIAFFLAVREGRKVRAICKRRGIGPDEYYEQLGQRQAQAVH